MASRIGREIRLSPVELGSQIAKKVEINLASGNPDPAVMPVKEIEEAYNEVIENIASSHSFTQGPEDRRN